MLVPVVPTIRRDPNWLAILHAEIEKARFKPFSWQSQNCCLFPADVVKAMTGVDIAAKWRKETRGKLAVAKILKAEGGVVALAEKVFKRYSLPSVPVSQARRGFVVLCSTELGHAGGVCLGSICAFPGPNGLVFKPLMECSHAFAV